MACRATKTQCNSSKMECKIIKIECNTLKTLFRSSKIKCKTLKIYFIPLSLTRRGARGEVKTEQINSNLLKTKNRLKAGYTKRAWLLNA
jgi:hypothetical protein